MLRIIFIPKAINRLFSYESKSILEILGMFIVFCWNIFRVFVLGFFNKYTKTILFLDLLLDILPYWTTEHLWSICLFLCPVVFSLICPFRLVLWLYVFFKRLLVNLIFFDSFLLLQEFCFLTILLVWRNVFRKRFINWNNFCTNISYCWFRRLYNS